MNIINRLLVLFSLLSLGFYMPLKSQHNKFEQFQKEVYENDGHYLPYRILYPKNFNPNQQYPLVLFLHGSGERGNDNEKQLTYIGDRLLQERNHGFDEAIYILPQCPTNDMWVDSIHRDDLKSFKNLYIQRAYKPSESMRLVEGLMRLELSKKYIDKNKVAITGLSMGGFGTLDLLERHPEWFHKAAPICGGGNIANAKRYSNNTSIRLYHGSSDTVVSPDLSRALYDRLRADGANVSYLEYPGVNHNAWDFALKEPDYIHWLISPDNKK